MIVRTWRGVTATDRTDAYLEYLRDTGLRDYAATPGNAGVSVLRRPRPEGDEWLIVSWWDSWDAIRRFAGDDPGKARFYPRDSEYFLSVDEHVDHYEVVLEER